MCGIYGYVGKNDAIKEVYEGLNKLQYRGYDSCGIAYFDNGFKIIKTVGTLNNLNLPKIKTNISFGHTRWATNGEVNLSNTHPHVSYNEEIFIVHNGIITNADILKQDMLKHNIKFYSETDTEVIANLIASAKGNEEENIKNLYKILKGSFSLIIGNSKGELYLLKQFSPLNVVYNENGIYISSDISSLKSGEYYSLNDGDILKISNNQVFSITDENIEFKKLETSEENLSLGEFDHYMIKEINETPKALLNTYKYIQNKNFEKIIKRYKNITMLGCGTAYHSCLIGEYLFNKLNRFNVNTSLASSIEIKGKIKSNHLHIIVSQSGETADCIKAAQEIKNNGGKILLITNQDKCSLSKFADFIILTQANKEVAVASTKTYCAQVFVFAYLYNKILNKNYDINIVELANKLKKFIDNTNIENAVEQLINVDKLIMIAKGIDYITLMEASLKIREINYLYTIPIISSELKHGTLSLIDENSKILTLNTSENLNNLTLAINEIKSRGGNVIDINLNLVNIEECYKPIFAIIPFQLLTYELAIKKGLNPDMPRNLAKSVTVE